LPGSSFTRPDLMVTVCGGIMIRVYGPEDTHKGPVLFRLRIYGHWFRFLVSRAQSRQGRQGKKEKPRP